VSQVRTLPLLPFNFNDLVPKMTASAAGVPLLVSIRQADIGFSGRERAVSRIRKMARACRHEPLLLSSFSDPRKGRIAQHIMWREHAEITHLVGHDRAAGPPQRAVRQE
jgi:hypothetical protein